MHPEIIVLDSKECVREEAKAAASASKGQIISKANYQAMNSSKKQINEFVFTTMRRVFVRFFGRN